MRFSNVVYFIIIIVPVFFSCKKEYSCEKCITVETPEGNVFFYTTGSCVNGKPITLIVDGNLYLTVDVTSTRPECSTPGIVPAELTAGRHSWEALCGSGRTIAGGVIDVMPGSCQVEEIK